MSDYYGHMTMEDGSHGMLSPDQALELWGTLERSADERARIMPTSDDAMQMIFDAHQRMISLGWEKGLGFSGVKRDEQCAVREDGSTGIWSGRVDHDGKYVHYCDGVSLPRNVWLKSLADLTDDERAKMAECDKDYREWSDRIIQSLISHDAKGQDDE